MWWASSWDEMMMRVGFVSNPEIIKPRTAPPRPKNNCNVLFPSGAKKYKPIVETAEMKMDRTRSRNSTTSPHISI